MPLTLAAAGERKTIVRIGGNSELRGHLADMGFVAGADVSVVAAMGGNLIVSIKESRVAISREMACKIMV